MSSRPMFKIRTKPLWILWKILPKMPDATSEGAIRSPADLESAFPVGPVLHEPVRADRIFDLAYGDKVFTIITVDRRTLAPG
jgi:hypothetical protein